MSDRTDPDETAEFTVTFTRTVTVQVPASLVPEDFRMPKRMRSLPDDLYEAIIAAVPQELRSTAPDDFGELDSIADADGDASIGD